MCSSQPAWHVAITWCSIYCDFVPTSLLDVICRPTECSSFISFCGWCHPDVSLRTAQQLEVFSRRKSLFSSKSVSLKVGGYNVCKTFLYPESRRIQLRSGELYESQQLQSQHLSICGVSRTSKVTKWRSSTTIRKKNSYVETMK